MMRNSNSSAYSPMTPQKAEEFHEPLNSVFCILPRRRPKIKPELLLRFANKRLNDTIRPDGPVPALFVYRTLPTFPLLNKYIAGQKKGMDALWTTRKKVANIQAEKRMSKAIKSNLPPAVKHKDNNGDKVYAYSERKKN